MNNSDAQPAPQVCEIPLTQGKVAIVDAEDYAYVSQFRWQANNTRRCWYAVRQIRRGEGKSTRFYLHRVILNALPRQQVDHRNGDGLDCRRSNLRLATADQNRYNVRTPTNNKTGFKGVVKRGRKYVAAIRYKRKCTYLGTFTDPQAAARAYDQKACELFGEFAFLNFPDSAHPEEQP